MKMLTACKNKIRSLRTRHARLRMLADRKRGGLDAQHCVDATLIRGDNWKRYYTPIVHALTESGYTLLLDPSRRFLLDGGEPFDSAFFKNPNVFRRRPRQAASPILITDDPNYFLNKAPAYTRAVLLTDRPRDEDAFGPVSILPFGMHPSTLKFAPESSVTQTCCDARKVRLGFFGNINPDVYRRSEDLESQGLYTRGKLIESILQHFDSEVTYIDESSQLVDLDHYLQSSRILIVNSCRAVLNAYQYFDCLKASRYFLGCPGIKSPLAHNLTEAMSVGCIPVCQAPDLILLGMNLVSKSFTNLNELASVIDGILKESDEEWQANCFASHRFFVDRMSLNAVASAITDPAEKIAQLVVRRGTGILHNRRIESVR